MLFDVVADTIRDRAAIAGELRAQTAQARASALALSVLPLAFTGLLALTDPGVLAFLLGTVGGWLCLTLGLDAAGGWWLVDAPHRVGGGPMTGALLAAGWAALVLAWALVPPARRSMGAPRSRRGRARTPSLRARSPGVAPRLGRQPR